MDESLDAMRNPTAHPHFMDNNDDDDDVDDDSATDVDSIGGVLYGNTNISSDTKRYPYCTIRYENERKSLDSVI
jgi:hypothetical protein